MGVKDVLQDALQYLAPFYSTKRLTLEDLFKCDPEIAGELRGLERKSAHKQIVYAGTQAGSLLVMTHNKSFDEADLDIMDLLDHTGSEYAMQAYHAKKCGCNFEMNTDNINGLLKQFSMLWQKLYASPNQKNKSFRTRVQMIISSCDAGTAFGQVLFKWYGTSKLGEYARMTIPQALQFLNEVAEEYLGRN